MRVSMGEEDEGSRERSVKGLLGVENLSVRDAKANVSNARKTGRIGLRSARPACYAACSPLGYAATDRKEFRGDAAA